MRGGRTLRAVASAAWRSASSASRRTFGTASAVGLGLAGAGAFAFAGEAHLEQARALSTPPLPTEEEWNAQYHAPLGRLHRQTTMAEGEEGLIDATKITKFVPFLIISHPRAVVTQSALGVLTDIHPGADILVVSDKYNYDDDGGNRIYSGSFARTTSASHKGRLMINAYSINKSKVDEELLMPLSDTPYGKNVHMCSNAYVAKLDVKSKLVELSDGRVYAFGKCLLATGCREIKLPGIPENLKQHVTNLRKVKDFDKVQSLVLDGKIKNIVVVGGGFLGCQVAAKLAETGKIKQVEVIHAYVEPGALYRYVPTYFSDYVTEKLRALGVSERPYHMVLNMKDPLDKSHNLQLALQGFEKATIPCGHVVFAPTHLEGNVELATSSGLEIDKHCGGILVNNEMLAQTDIYVAGDTASYPDPVLGRRRMQSYDHSYHSGALAAHNMATGGREAYRHLPVITSSGGPMGMDVVVLGDIDSSMEMYSLAQTDRRGHANSAPGWEEWEKGIVYYMRNHRVVGAMLLNLSGRTDDVRRMIRDGARYDKRGDDDSIPELDKVIELGLLNSQHRYSPARGQGLSRFYSIATDI